MAESVVESICVVLIDDEFWPVFVFPDHSAPQNFVKTRPKDKALALPCLILCRHEFVWCGLEELAEFVPSDNYTDELDKETYSGRERVKAFEEATEFHGMDYYHDLITKKAGDTLNRALIVGDDSNEEDDGEDNDDIDSEGRFTSSSLSLKKRPVPAEFAYPTPKKTPTSKKQKFVNLAIEDDADDVDFPDPSTFTPTKATGNRTRPRSNTNKPQAPKLDAVAQEQLRLMSIKKGDGKKPIEEEQEQEITHDPFKVNIYAGNEDKLFIVERKSLERYPNFSEEIVGNEDVGYRIRWEKLDDVNLNTFSSVVEFLNTGDYTPIYVGGHIPHLKGVKSINQMEAAAEKAGLLWDFAVDFQMEDLQQLVRRKIDAQSPLASNSLLILTRMVYWRDFNGTKVDKDMRNWLKDQISERFYDIMVKDAYLLKRVLQGDEELRCYVHDRLAKEKGMGSRVAVDEEDEDDEEVYEDD